MFVLCVLHNKDKKTKPGKSVITKIPAGVWMFVLCGLNTDKRQNAGQLSQTKK